MIIGTAVHLEPDPAQALCWNLEALSRAQHVPERAAEFLASLYVNLGQSYEMLGDLRKQSDTYPGHCKPLLVTQHRGANDP